MERGGLPPATNWLKATPPMKSTLLFLLAFFPCHSPHFHNYRHRLPLVFTGTQTFPGLLWGKVFMAPGQAPLMARQQPPSSLIVVVHSWPDQKTTHPDHSMHVCLLLILIPPDQLVAIGQLQSGGGKTKASQPAVPGANQVAQDRPLMDAPSASTHSNCVSLHLFVPATVLNTSHLFGDINRQGNSFR